MSTGGRILHLASSVTRRTAQPSGRVFFSSRSGCLLDEPHPPNYTFESIKPSKNWVPQSEPVPTDPMAYVRKPVTSAYAIEDGKISSLDSAVLNANGSILHGRYGELANVSDDLPLEYLALLRPAAEGVAAVASLGEETGTVLVYGATQPAGMAATQIASSKGNAVIAVADGNHSGSADMMEALKSMVPEPGTAVPEEYALVKANFRGLVEAAVSGDDGADDCSPDSFLGDFQTNLLDYIKAYPDTLPAAVSADVMDFDGKEKDRKYFKENMETYLSQFQKGASPIDPEQLKEYFTMEQYAIWKSKFGIQTTAVITDDTASDDFSPAELVKNMVQSPESPTGSKISDLEFNVIAPSSQQKSGEGAGPVLGAILVATKELLAAIDALAKAKTLREKAEALQFLPDAQKNAYAAASSVASIAKKAGKPVIVLGGKMDGFETVEPTESHVQEALSAMEIQDDGSSTLNYYIQVYRAGDYPVYADYAVHRASEELSGPRQIVVTK